MERFYWKHRIEHPQMDSAAAGLRCIIIITTGGKAKSASAKWIEWRMVESCEWLQIIRSIEKSAKNFVHWFGMRRGKPFFYRVMICEQIWQKKTGIGMSTNGPALYGYSDKVLLCPEKLRHFKRLHYLFGLFAINSHRKWFCSLPIVSSENLFVFYLPKTIHCILVCLRKTNYCIDIALYKY